MSLNLRYLGIGIGGGKRRWSVKYYSFVHNRLRFFNWLLPSFPSIHWLHVYGFVHDSNSTNERLTYGN